MTNSELALLSLLSEAPRHGYEIEQTIRERGMRNWTELAFSSIYFVLARLVKQGLAAAQIQPGHAGRPNRKVYTITPAGEDALLQGILDGIRRPESGGQRFLLALSCQPLLGQRKLQQALRERILFIDELLTDLSANPASHPGLAPAHVSAMFDYSATLLQAERTWLQDYLHKIAEEK
jgi:DNA-binding PadR family transcriptional regulator